jgi:membrane protease YdiL (CAAX protease family)
VEGADKKIQRYSELARTGINGWQQYVISIFLILAFYVVLGNLLIIAINAAAQNITWIGPFVNYIMMNSIYLAVLLAIYLSVCFVHKRDFKSLITPYGKISWKRVFFGFSLYFFLVLLSTLIEYFIHPGDFKVTLNTTRLLISLPVILILTPIQTTTEELFFRGYIIQSFGLIIKNNYLLAFISGLLFTLPHLGNPEVSKGFLIMEIFYFSIGFLFALLTLKSNTLEIAIGAHAANNLFPAILVNYESSVLETSSVFTLTYFDPLFSLIQFIIMAAVFYYLIIVRWGRSLT